MSHKILTEQTSKFLDVATYQTNPEQPDDLTESAEVVANRISDASAHLSLMFGSHSKAAKAPAAINESVNRYLSQTKQNTKEAPKVFNTGDKVQTIMQGQQEGTVEKVEVVNGITKVYHRHENGNLYASSPSNLKMIKPVNESAYGDAKYDLGKKTPAHIEEKKKAVSQHLSIIADLKTKMAAAQTDEEYDKHKSAHDLEVAKLANTQTYMKGGIVECAIEKILDEMNVESLDQLDESTQKTLISIATEIAPHLL